MFISKKDITIIQKDRIITHLPYLIEFYKKIQLSLFVACFEDSCKLDSVESFILQERLKDYDFSQTVCFDYNYALNYNTFYSSKYPRIWEIISKIVQSNTRKRSRVAKRFENMFNKAVNPIYFGTLTFTDKVLDSTSQKTRRVYIRRFLKAISKEYLANIDFGDLNSREHYHCIFSTSNKELFKKWKYGFVNVKSVRYSNSDIKRCSKYLVKLINHCVKGSAGYLISSRNII